MKVCAASVWRPSICSVALARGLKEIITALHSWCQNGMHFPAGGISTDEEIEPAMKLKQEAHNIWREAERAFMKKAKRDGILSTLSGVMV